jgi:MazG family protein
VERLDRLETLVAIMDRLRGPDGCPWDREQDYASLRRYLLEEAYEAAEAIDRDDRAALCEELGDLLFEIVFLARLAQEEDRFSLRDVIRGVAEKLVRRHPHVFGSAEARTADEVARNWETIKRREKSVSGRAASLLDGAPTALPAMLKAQWLGSKAAQVGFDWKRPEQVLDKVGEELDELRRAVGARAGTDAVREEIGDILFSIVMLARHLGIDAEAALHGTNVKFRQRFGAVEAELQRRGVEPADAGLELLEQLWQRAKRPGDGV